MKKLITLILIFSITGCTESSGKQSPSSQSTPEPSPSMSSSYDPGEVDKDIEKIKEESIKKSSKGESQDNKTENEKNAEEEEKSMYQMGK